jgi:hypothetical protein
MLLVPPLLLHKNEEMILSSHPRASERVFVVGLVFFRMVRQCCGAAKQLGIANKPFYCEYQIYVDANNGPKGILDATVVFSP